MKVGLIGGGFHHAYSSTLDKKPKYFEWDKGNKNNDITFYIDEAILPGCYDKTTKRKFAWVVESKLIIPRVLEDIKNNYKKISESYEYVITHHKEIYDLADNFVYLPPHGYWIEDPKLYSKSKLVSMLSSNKNMGPGHAFRLGWVNRLRDKLDLYGRGFKTIAKKEDALVDYMFSVTIENDKYETYWSEKILDCFACGTIPIYYGAQDIGNYFNIDGIILLDENFDINQLTPKLYYEKMDAIKDNFNRVLQYNVIEDIIYEKYLKI